jgi:hypothetical protein
MELDDGFGANLPTLNQNRYGWHDPGIQRLHCFGVTGISPITLTDQSPDVKGPKNRPPALLAE